ncbi:glycosyl hydrolase [Flavobacterium undicola]|uniref:glycosyl hydrolase n=1 Tax=Flavobacterium undicola TaxID=1932779 RepID=UPI001378AE3F|nr:glycosyl hydrolase [Flavobacterium undicola]MBA0882953.1 T9SS type A sorting domain-containing protein [Flavobacterium undicola]
MKKKYFFLLLMLSVFACQIYAQAPNLPVKAGLVTTLSGSKIFNSSTSSDIVTFPLSNPNEFTLEVIAKINAAQGRGLDVEVKNASGLGIRTSLDKTTFNNSTVLSSISNLSTSVDNGQEQTYRYAVKDGMAHIYQDGHYLTSKAFDLVGDANAGAQPIVYGADNMLGKWAGIVGNNSGKPTDYGWANTYASLPWNTANSTSGVRYIDVTSGHTLESDNSVYKGRIMYIRWDGSAYSASTYSYPVKLEKGLQYEFSWLYEYVANAAAGAKMNVSITSAPNGTGGVVTSKTFVTGSANKLRKGDFSFVSSLEGTYYLTITGDYALFGIANLKLKSTNLINPWDGLAENNAGKPSDYGWINPSAVTLFNTANSTSGVRYVDVTSGHTFESDGTNYSGRLMYIRWDSSVVENSTYSFPVQLEASRDYQFSWIYDYISNGAPNDKIKVSISTSADGTGTVLSSKTFTSGAINKLRKGDLSFQSQTAGTYYINITGDKALFGIGDLKVALESVPKIVIGKNYANGAVDMVVSSVTYEDAAYAPEKSIAPPTQILETTTNLNVGAFSKSKVVLKSSASLYLNNAYNPLINSIVDLNSTDARVYFENVKPSGVIGSYLNLISINGVAASNNANVFVTTYGNGAVVVPHSSDYQPLEVFSGENYGGDAKQYNIVTPYTNLGAFDNTIKSFKLKKGYMATFASNSNGTGYSRVYVAESQDLMVPVLPPYLNGTISFIRTMRWNEVTKKGLAGGSQAAQDASNISWYYNWNTGGNTTPNIEYVPIRQTLYWPDFGPANTKAGYTHFLGYNEPDRPDQSNMTVDQAIGGWPGLMQSGLRLGSPVTSDPFNPWMASFMTEAEKRNYRVDYVVLHCYWYKTAAQWASDLQNIYNKYKRPIWITEWNIGANWTGNSFPDGPVMLTDANATKHKNDLISVLNVLETADYVERYSIYNWVQDSRAMYVTIDDAFKTRNPNWANYAWLQTAPVIAKSGNDNIVLTPAGEYYAKNASKKAYTPAREFVSVWKPLVETLSYKLSSDYKNITINWTGVNQDLINRYVVERRLEGETDFSVFYDSTNPTVLSVNDEVHSKAEYRMKVVGKDNTETAYSPVITFTQAVIADTPTGLSGEAISTTIINLNWPAVDRAEAYNLWRANSIDGSYELIASYLTGTSFQDTGLVKNTSYNYAITALNSGGESAKSTPFTVSTLDLVIPRKVSNIVLASGDAKVKLEWSNMYDAKFYVKRSISELGSFTTIAIAESGNYVDLTALNGVTYYYKVVAFNEIGEGAESEVIVSRPNLGQHAYYDFSENTGLNAHDQWGNYDGTLADTTTWTVGKAGRGVGFNGSSTSYIQLKEGVVEGLNDFTISTWVNLNSLSNWSRIFDFGDSTGSWMALEAANGSGKLSYEIVTSGQTKNTLSSQYTMPLNRWVHLAYVQEGNIGKIIVDGVEVASGTVTIKPSALGKTKLNELGKSKYADPYLNASMDEFKIYNRALSVAEIAESAKLSQSITLSPVVQKEMGDADFSPATATSGLAIAYSSSDESVVNIVDGKLHILAAGTTTITATQAGNADYSTAAPQTQLVTVVKKNQTIDFASIETKMIGDPDFNPAATAISGLAVTYSSSDESVASIVNGQIHIVSAGSCEISASQPGDNVYSSAPVVKQQLIVNKEFYFDGDHDGFGSSIVALLPVNETPEGYATNNTDCDDSDANVHEPIQYYVDADKDGFGSTATEMLCSSVAPEGYATNNTDCNDGDVTVHEPILYYVDTDKDGFGSTATEMLCSSVVPEGYATNKTDCNDNDRTVHEPILYYVDADKDGFGSNVTAMLCASVAPQGYATNNTDCNDSDTTVHEPILYYVDADHDGFGSTATAMLCSSIAPEGYATNSTDCNDSKFLYADNDGDGLGAGSVVACGVENNDDCDDTNAVQLTARIPAVYALNAAVDEKNTIYIGYASSSLNVSVAPAGGTAPYAYVWNTNQNTQSVSVSAAGTYTVLVTDAKGCQTSASIVINAINVQCGNSNDKVVVCHNGKEICVSPNAVQTHLNHGDKLGSCNRTVSRNNAADKTLIVNEDTDVTAYPNPVVSEVNVKVSEVHTGAKLVLYNVLGVKMKSISLTSTLQLMSLEGLPSGNYLLYIFNGNDITVKNIIKQ